MSGQLKLHLGAIKDSKEAGLSTKRSQVIDRQQLPFFFFFSHQAQNQFKTEGCSQIPVPPKPLEQARFSGGGKPEALFENNESIALGQ